MPDLHEPIGKDMKQEPPNEFLSIQCLECEDVSGFSIPVGKGDFAVLHIHDAVIGYGHPVSVSADVIKDRLWPCKGLFTKHHPVF